MSSVRLFRDQEGVLEAEVAAYSYGPVQLICTFPFSQPEQFISVRTADGKEIALLPNLSILDTNSQIEARAELERRYMTPCITRIVSIRRKKNQWIWMVDTTFGEITFRMDHLHENVSKINEYCRIVTDREGRRYEVPDLGALDLHSRSEWNKVN